MSRGWLSDDLTNFREDREGYGSVVTGVLYRGDNKTKYSKLNAPFMDEFLNVYPEELALLFSFSNQDEAGQFMLKQVDLDPDARTPQPDVPSVVELTNFGISPERHQAYETMWNAVTYFGVLSNAAMWLLL